MPDETFINQADSYEALKERINQMLDEGDGNKRLSVQYTFPESVIVIDWETDDYYELPYVEMEGEIILGAPKQVDKMYVSVKSSQAEITGPIVLKNEAQKIAYAAVLVPNEPDLDGDVLTAEKIERVAHEWMASYRNVDLEHTLNNIAVPVESYILPMPMHVGKFVLPRGTWVLAAKVQDDETWERVLKGELTGYSVMGIRRHIYEDAVAAKSINDIALKKTLLADLGDDWIACAVSIVDNPAVPKAKFFAIKSEDKNMGVIARLKEMLSPKSKEKEWEGETINTSTPIDDAKEVNSSMDGQNDEVEALKSSIKSLEGRLEALESYKGSEPETKPEDEGGSGQTEPEGGNPEGGEGEGGELEALKAEIEALKSSNETLKKQVAQKSAGSQSLKGQDGHKAPAVRNQGDRDLFGRKKRN